MRDQLMAVAGLEVTSFDVYEVPGHEYMGGDAAVHPEGSKTLTSRGPGSGRPGFHNGVS
jgi:hypothetical protein